VYTFQQLAELSVDEIESALKAAGQIADRGQINQWLAGAREHAAAQLSRQSADSADIEPAGETNASIEEGDAEGGGNAREIDKEEDEEGEWESLRAFIVEFRIRRAKEQIKERQIRIDQRKIDKQGIWLEDDKDKNSTVVEGERLYQWMVEHVGEEMWQEPVAERLIQAPPTETVSVETPLIEALLTEGSSTETSSVEVLPAEKPRIETVSVEAPATEALPARVKITQVGLFQPPSVKISIDIGRAGQPFLGRISGAESFALEVGFELPELAVADIASRQATYIAQFHARVLTTGASIHLGSTEPDVPVAKQLAYTARLPKAVLPPGTYRLGILVMFQDGLPRADYIEVPLLQVV